MFVFLCIYALACERPLILIYLQVEAFVLCCFFYTLLNRFLSRPLWHDSEQSLSGWDSPPD